MHMVNGHATIVAKEDIIDNLFKIFNNVCLTVFVCLCSFFAIFFARLPFVFHELVVRLFLRDHIVVFPFLLVQFQPKRNKTERSNSRSWTFLSYLSLYDSSIQVSVRVINTTRAGPFSVSLCSCYQHN